MSYESHYKSHLSHFYTWMFGDFESMVQSQSEFFERYSVFPSGSKVALDLGAGPGYQSIALLGLGFRPVAVDTSRELLEDLVARAPGIPIYCRDFRDLSFANNLQPELVVCMGDTLTHLRSIGEVQSVIEQSYGLLQPRGRLILTFRDLSEAKLDLDRFILVRSDAERILTCFLEDEVNTVKVFDLLHERTGDTWVLKSSYYRKLKIPVAKVSEILLTAGFSIEGDRLNSGMDVMIGVKK